MPEAVEESRPPEPDRPLASIVLYRNPQDVGYGRYILAKILENDPAQDAALQVASELMTNAVIHPEQGPGRGELKLRVGRVARSVLIEVIDPGTIRRSVIPMPRLPDMCSEHGRGLGIVDRLATVWGTYVTKSGKRCVWAVVSPPSSLPAYVPGFGA